MGEPQATIFASLHRSRSCQGNVFDGMSQSSAATIADGHFLVEFNNGDLADQFVGVATVLSQLVL